VLVIDGMRLSDPSATDGGYNFANLFADDIARIEILRGPQAILWGSSSIGGVIAVHPQAQKPLEASFSVEAGSRETVYARAGLGGKGELVTGAVADRLLTDGISARAMAPSPMERPPSASGTPPMRWPPCQLDLRGYGPTAATISTARRAMRPSMARSANGPAMPGSIWRCWMAASNRLAAMQTRRRARTMTRAG
jgi:vitamin B12 transporter